MKEHGVNGLAAEVAVTKGIFTVLAKELKDKLGISAVTDDVLRALGLVDRDGAFTKAGLLLADSNEFPGIHIVKFGATCNEIRARKSVVGVSVLTQLLEAVDMYKQYYQYEVIESIERKTVVTIPEKAFREAIATALLYRSWDMVDDIAVRMHPNRIEIEASCDLSETIDYEEAFSERCLESCDWTLATLFLRLQYIERLGSIAQGIRATYNGYVDKSSITFAANKLRIVLPLLSKAYSITQTEEEILQFLSCGQDLTSCELAEQLAVSKETAIRMLRPLVKKQYVEVISRGRGTKYRKAII